MTAVPGRSRGRRHGGRAPAESGDQPLEAVGAPIDVGAEYGAITSPHGVLTDSSHRVIVRPFHHSDVLWRLLRKLPQAALEQVYHVEIVIREAVADDDRAFGAAQRLISERPDPLHMRVAVVLELSGRDEHRLDKGRALRAGESV